MEDILLTCIQCETEFVFNIREQLKYERLGFTEPRRCPQCRRHKSKPQDTQEGKKIRTRRKDHGLSFDSHF